MDYESMSDDAINRAVELRYLGFETDGTWTPDYCNDWSEMGPLIAEYHIDMVFDDFGGPGKEDWACAATENAVDHCDGIETIHSLNRNPLRAAAICWLKMKDGEKDGA